jgi:hypothetical protein
MRTIGIAAILACATSFPARASLITNGGFESGLAGWTTLDQFGGDGTFLAQTGTSSPVNGFPVPAPPEGITAAMSDSQGPGSHVLYQDLVVPTGILGGSLNFALFLNNGADDFHVADHLDFSTADLNQQARVDILSTSADPFGLDVLQNFYQTAPGDPLVSGYTSFLFDITPLLLGHQGETLRLRFAEVDNVLFFNLGVDQVSIDLTTRVPEPASWVLVGLSLVGICSRRVRRC